MLIVYTGTAVSVLLSWLHSRALEV